MIFLEKLKLCAEVITSTTTAIVMIIHLFKLCNPIKKFLKMTLPSFFKGYTDLNGKKIRFFKGLKLQRERNMNILKAISPGFEMEDILVLDKEVLFDIISKSGAFRTIRQHRGT
jgi:hypothetical protein